MTQRHYIAIAAMLAEQHERHTDPLARQALADVALEYATLAKQDNPRFKASKFFDAAGFPELTNRRMGLS